MPEQRSGDGLPDLWQVHSGSGVFWVAGPYRKTRAEAERDLPAQRTEPATTGCSHFKMIQASSCNICKLQGASTHDAMKLATDVVAGACVKAFEDGERSARGEDISDLVEICRELIRWSSRCTEISSVRRELDLLAACLDRLAPSLSSSNGAESQEKSRKGGPI